MTLNPYLVDKVRAAKTAGKTRRQAAKDLGLTNNQIISLCNSYHITGWPRGAAARNQTGFRNPAYKNGLSRATVRRTTEKAVLADGRDLCVCERCGAQSSIAWPRHHVDRDRSNNVASNIEVLCVACHNKEHMAERTRSKITGQFL